MPAGVEGSGTPPAVVFDQVSVTIGGVRILEKVNAEVPRGSATAVIGPNGAGKTTLLMALLGQTGFDGRIHIESTSGHASRIGYVPQRLDFDRGAPMTVLDLMVMGLQRRPLWIGLARRHRERALALLDAVQAAPLASRRLGALSGGELQRVLLALSLEQDPDILILDEPSAGVDIGGENLICELLETLRTARAFTQVMVTHDLSLVTAHATHVICLNRTVMGTGPTRETLRPEVLAATFGIHLGLATLPEMTGARTQGCRSEGHGHA